MGKVNKSSHVTEIHKIPECGGYLMYILVLVYTNLDENLLPVYNLIFNSLVAKNRYNLPFYGIYSGFFFFTLFGNLFPAFTFFLNVFHPAFRDELVVCPETAGIMQGIGQLVTFI